MGQCLKSFTSTIDRVRCGFDVKAANTTQAEFVTPEMTHMVHVSPNERAQWESCYFR